MLLSQTAHYALRAIYYLLTQDLDKSHLTKDIAEITQIPAPYLARILSTMAKRGILQSRTGMGGGFSINKESLNTNLYDIVVLFDNLDSIRDCIFGFLNCCGNEDCMLHDKWVDIKNQLIEMLKSTTLEELVNHEGVLDWSKMRI
ncbi:MAG: Rrf2 family transcriptional regulator [candidate division Zixibacteria bacterium]|nr:Rrf2 family transcriptional regulator [candidate division Zixibacteria bacterium]